MVKKSKFDGTDANVSFVFNENTTFEVLETGPGGPLAIDGFSDIRDGQTDLSKLSFKQTLNNKILAGKFIILDDLVVGYKRNGTQGVKFTAGDSAYFKASVFIAVEKANPFFLDRATRGKWLLFSGGKARFTGIQHTTLLNHKLPFSGSELWLTFAKFGNFRSCSDKDEPSVNITAYNPPSRQPQKRGHVAIVNKSDDDGEWVANPQPPS